jgi:uncharacterized protein
LSSTDEQMEALDRSTCIELARTVAVGRVAWTEADGRVAVLPVNSIVDNDDVVFRTAEGSKLDAVRHGWQLSFQGDDVETALHVGCSVLVWGRPHVVQEPDEIRRLQSVPIAPWTRSPKPFFVRISTERVTGRRILLHPGKVTIQQDDGRQVQDQRP